MKYIQTKNNLRALYGLNIINVIGICNRKINFKTIRV